MGSRKKQSVSDKILDLINPLPISHDPEDDIHEETSAKVVEKYDDELGESDEELVINKSKLKKPVALLEDEDKRYTGKRISRKTLRSDDSGLEEHSSELGESFDESDANDSDNAGHSNENIIERKSDDSDDYDKVENESDDDEDESGSDLEDDRSDIDSNGESERDNDFQHISGQNIDAEIEKGNCVRNQLCIWDNLLECRIQLQKCLVAANRMPHYEVFGKFVAEGGSDFTSNLEQCKMNTKTLLDKLSSLRETLLASYPETKSIVKSKLSNTKMSSCNAMDEEILSDTDAEEDEVENVMEMPQKGQKRKLEEYENLLDSQHKEFLEFRNANIQKWNDKTRVAGGNISSRNFATFEQSTLKQIEQILSNRQRLIQRTRLKRNVYDILGQDLQQPNKPQESVLGDSEINLEHLKLEDKSKEFNSEIFDDSDFYHQLLRELIERKSSDVTDPVQLGRQWIEIQKLRSKMKRKIDVKATKGRRLRYTVHPKLVNFMAPISKCTWNEEAKSELFSSLFGNSNKGNSESNTK
ncbi:protein AATF [Anabrus simplex]|uniref:protein AATF n=1 Tax=Anabrus simplex TaxID=316456 RepID=UPI0035A27D3C